MHKRGDKYKNYAFPINKEHGLMETKLSQLPLPSIASWEPREVLKICVEAHRHLAKHWP